MRLLLLFCFLLTLVAVSAQLDERTSLNNRALYTPQRRNSDDLPWVSPNISYINAFSKPHTTGLTDDVAWDRYSLYVKGQRLFIYSGEFHPFRLPVVELWRDILQKAKAAGNNAISIYVPWHLSNPSEGVLEMTGILDLQPFFDMAKEVGLWIIARPGPFINAETTGGGIPGWVIRKHGDMRTNSTDYFESWQQYYEAIAQLIARNQVSEGGPVVLFQLENEFDRGVFYDPHMEELKAAAIRHGIKVPLTHNNAAGKGHYSAGPGKVDIAAIDAYPAGFSCARGDSRFPVLVDSFNNWSERVNRDAPYYFAEIQGGSFDPWGGDGGYDQCRAMTGVDFDRVQFRFTLAVRVSLINKYMWYGGTNWGGIAAPVVYTSYDYGTFVSESRNLTEKYHEHKLLGLFLRNAPEIRQAEVVGQLGEFSEYSLKTQPYIGRPARNGSFYTSDRGLWTTELRNPDSLSAFYIVRQSTWNFNISADFVRSSTLDIWTPEAGDLTIPQFGGRIAVGGRDSRIIPTDLTFGGTTLRYSTAEVLLSCALDDQHDILILYGWPGRNETFEVVFAGLGEAQVLLGDAGSTNMTTWSLNGDLVLTFAIPTTSTSATLTIGTTTVLVFDHDTAFKVWQPTLAASENDWSSFAEVGTNSSAIVIGPYLVRNSTLDGDGRLSLYGDTAAVTETTIFGPSGVTSITWNGAAINATFTDFGIQAILPGPDSLNSTIPTFHWVYQDSLPEAQPGFDDSTWVQAGHTSTNQTTLPLNGGVALVATDYGFVTGNILWRGHFNATNDPISGLYVNVTGGTAFAFSAYLNGVFLGFNESISGSDTPFKSLRVDFPEGALATNGSSNVVLLIQDHMGLEEDTALDKKSKSLRGISEVRLLTPSDVTPPRTFTSWKVQGNAGGEVGFPDRVRGSLNEGGFFGERQGWHLPGFDDSTWPSIETPSLDGPGVRFFRTTLDLDLPDGHDVGMSFRFGGLGGYHRALLFVNGWQFGKFAASIGPQTIFPVHPGIIVSGQNTVALALWSYDAANATVVNLSFGFDWLVKGGVGLIEGNNPGWELRT